MQDDFHTLQNIDCRYATIQETNTRLNFILWHNTLSLETNNGVGSLKHFNAIFIILLI